MIDTELGNFISMSDIIASATLNDDKKSERCCCTTSTSCFDATDFQKLLKFFRHAVGVTWTLHVSPITPVQLIGLVRHLCKLEQPDRADHSPNMD